MLRNVKSLLNVRHELGTCDEQACYIYTHEGNHKSVSFEGFAQPQSLFKDALQMKQRGRSAARVTGLTANRPRRPRMYSAGRRRQSSRHVPRLPLPFQLPITVTTPGQPLAWKLPPRICGSNAAVSRWVDRYLSD